MIDPKFTKEVSGFLYISEENEIPISLSGNNISLTLCDRTGTTNNLGNYFVSVNLPTDESKFPKNSSLSYFYPELQQLNVDKILLIKIPNTAYTEFIDARSIKLNLPGTGSSANFYTIFSSTYSDSIPDKYGERSPLMGDHISYLFSDSVNLPYTGLSVNQLGQIISHSATTSWRPITGRYQDRPSATSYGEVKLSNDTINTDRRMSIHKSVFIDGLYNDFRGEALGFYQIKSVGGNLALFVNPYQNFFKNSDVITLDMFDHTLYPSLSGNASVQTVFKNQYSTVPMLNAPNQSLGPWDVIRVNKPLALGPANQTSGTIYRSSGTYYNYDIPIGFAVLDKGLIVITHTDIVNSIDWTTGFLPDGTPNSAGDTTDIYFTSTNTSIYGDVEADFLLEFVSLDTVFKMRTTCNSLLGDFYISNNATWDNALALNPLAANQQVSVTEVGLYNEVNELVALAKFSEPIYKGAFDLFTFEIDINL
jgi:hypothetical protein